MSMLAFLALSASALDLFTRPFGAFEVGCDNRRTCHAVGVGPAPTEGEGPMGAGMDIQRGGGPDAPISVSFDWMYEEPLDGAIFIDGRPTAWSVDSSHDLAGDARAFVAAILTARSADIRDSAGKPIATLATEGASATFRWIDELQQRAGTVTALVAKGAKPASAVPPLPAPVRIALPVASTKPPRTLTASQLAGFRKDGDCDDDRPDLKPDYVRLDSTHTLALVFCSLGAYQGTSLPILVPDQGRPALAPLDVAIRSDPNYPADPSGGIVSADYDPKSRLLWEEARGRGLNDCGTNTAWAWDGSRFRVAFFSMLDACRGARTRITLWQTANRPDD